MDFRSHYLSYDELMAALQRLQHDHPTLVRLERIGSSAEGRPLYVIVVGTDPDRRRPALWVDANMHAGEVLGTNVALAFVDDLLAVHRGENRHNLSAPVVARVKDALVYVMPSLSPDGAEATRTTGRFVRSSPENDKPTRKPRWRSVDVDGDGLALRMRKLDPCGHFVESKNIPGLMVPRDIDDEGPFYSLYPEGVIDDFDGDVVPPWEIFDDNPLDLNRNFSSGWKPEPEQVGAGAFAGSSPEARAVMAYAAAHPELYLWVNLHTFGGVWIRPLGDKPDHKLPGDDRALLRLVEEWVSEHIGVPTVSGYTEFTYEPEKPLCGDIIDFALYQRGAYGWAIELWDLFARAGLPRKTPFVDVYSQQGRKEMELLARAAASWGGSPLRPWKAVKHPQLGDVDVGGLDPRTSIWNPPAGPLIDEVARKHSAVFLRLLALLPLVHVDVERVALGGDLFSLTVTVENRGGMSTRGPAMAKDVPHNEELRVIAKDADRVVDGAVRVVGHLAGTHAGRFGGNGTWPYQATADVSRRVVRAVVRGAAPVALQVGSVRTGFVDVKG